MEKENSSSISSSTDLSIINFLNIYKGLVLSIARKYKCHSFSIEELMNFGNEGLLEAKEKFNETLGVPFKTFAYRYIENAIKLEVSNNKNTLNVSSNNIEYSKAINSYVNSYYLDNGRQPLLDDIKDYMNSKYSSKFSNHDISLLMESTKCDSFDKEIDEDFTLSDTVASSDNPLDNYNKLEVKENISNLCNILTDEEKFVVSSRFGILGESEKNDSEIAKILSITNNKVRKIFEASMKKIKNNCILK